MPEVDISVDDLDQMFPSVDRDVLETIHGRLNDPNLAEVAAVLDSAAEKGKIPQRDYTEYVAKFLLDTEDLAQVGADPEEAVRGMQADRRARSIDWDDRLELAVRSGSPHRLVEEINEASRVGSAALQNPERASVPEGPADVMKRGMILLYQMIEEKGENGDVGDLDEIADAVNQLENKTVAKKVHKKIRATKRLVTNSGADYEEARDHVLDEENTPQQVRERARNLYFTQRFDITLDQVKDIVEDSKEWLEEYKEYAEQNKRAAAVEDE